MRVAAVHYHARRGGVTQVMQVTARVLKAVGVDTVLMVGEPVEVMGDVPLLVDPALAYGADEAPECLLARLEAQWGKAPDVWHIHNHALGKNLALPRLVRYLAARGERMLLHLHDFAEDFRAANYRDLAGLEDDPRQRQSFLYPVGDHVHYAVLTRHDAGALTSAGIPAGQIHVLPNPVEPPVDTPEGAIAHDPDPESWVYPVRGIRRKNLGELLLWSALRDGRRYSITLPPSSAVDAEPYARWKQQSAALNLPVTFEAGGDHYDALLAGAGAIITTSIAEGFGLVYAEPWLRGKPLAGRLIESVTDDLEAAGLAFPGMYKGLAIPLDWINREQVKATFLTTMQGLCDQYRLPAAAAEMEEAWAAWARRGCIDFGRLDESTQAAVIERVADDRGFARVLQPPQLAVDKAVIHTNAAAVRSALHPAAYAAHLRTVYEQIAAAAPTPVHGASGSLMALYFIKPDRLFLLRGGI